MVTGKEAADFLVSVAITILFVGIMVGAAAVFLLK